MKTKIIIVLALVVVGWLAWSKLGSGDGPKVSRNWQAATLRLEDVREQGERLRDEKPSRDDPRLEAHSETWAAAKANFRRSCG